MLATVNHSVGDKNLWLTDAGLKELFSCDALAPHQLYFTDKIFNETTLHEFTQYLHQAGIPSERAAALLNLHKQSGYGKIDARHEWLFS